MSNNLPAHYRTLFLGDLSSFCTEEDVWNFFQSIGEIEKIRVMRGKELKPLGYGFVTFASRDAAVRGLALDGSVFLGRPVKIGWAHMNVGPKIKMDAPEPTAQVHFSYLSKQLNVLITEATIRKVFLRFGEVKDITIKKSAFDDMQQQQSGYGFVHYPLTIAGIRSALLTTKEVRQVLVDDVLYDCALTHNLRSIIEKHRDQFLPELASMSREFAYTPEHFMKNLTARDPYMQQDVFRPNQNQPSFNSNPDPFRFQDMNRNRPVQQSYNPRPMDVFQQQQQMPRGPFPGMQQQNSFPPPPAPAFANKPFAGNFSMNDFNSSSSPRPPTHLLSNSLPQQQSSQNPAYMDNLLQTYPGFLFNHLERMMTHSSPHLPLLRVFLLEYPADQLFHHNQIHPVSSGIM